MTERPIPFSGPMVRALIAGTKTQTRRAIKGAPTGRTAYLLGLHRDSGVWGIHADVDRDDGVWRGRCPYGVPGDRLWVRETFAGSIAYERHGYPLKEWGNKIWYVADGEPRSGQWTRPRPSIHMPRCLSRITLEVTEVRVERLQDISEADAQAEGVEDQQSIVLRAGGSEIRGPVAEYAVLWEQINGPGSWEANPWVWCVSFRRVHG